MKQFMKISFLLVAFFALSLNVSAQKYGYVNSDLILSEVPEFKQMEPQLESLQKVLQKKGQKMVEDLQREAAAAEAQVQKGELSPVQQEAKQKELQEKQSKIMEFEQTMQQQLLAKRNELLEPILVKINDAISAVAKAEGYTMLFNGSPGAGILLYADDAQDATTAVKSHLGL
jgi:outer membrane protein